MKLHVDYFIKNMKDTFDVYPDRIFLYSIPLIFSLRLDAWLFDCIVGKKEQRNAVLHKRVWQIRMNIIRDKIIIQINFIRNLINLINFSIVP